VADITPTFKVQAWRDTNQNPDYINVRYKVIWDEPAYFEVVIFTVVQDETQANLSVLRVWDFEPGPNTPYGSVTLQIWDMAHEVVMHQVSHVKPRPEKYPYG